MLQIFGNLLTTFILQDENSQNFSSHRPYYEGERGSPTIPMWTYFIRSNKYSKRPSKLFTTID
jgi:hypothetical protein